MNQYDVAIIGGGLAGLTAAIELSLNGANAIVLEKGDYPRHKVCGEYVSNEVLPYLQRIGADPMKQGAIDINSFEISSPSGKVASARLPLGGFGISRYQLDYLLLKRAIETGAKMEANSQATDIIFEKETFVITTKKGHQLQARQVIGSFGKRSVLDRKMKRSFFNDKTDYVGVKHHFEGEFPDDLVALHNFEGGYCGLSKVETGHVNVCYLTTTRVFKKHHSIEELEARHLSSNPHLAVFFTKSRSVFKKPLVISQVSFASKKSVENHVLMAGDSAGLISPLCGNGMAMAIRAGKMSSEVTLQFLQNELTRQEMEQLYVRRWEKEFAGRLRFGRFMQPLFGKPRLSNFGIATSKMIPGILPTLIKQSHGTEF